MNFMFSEFLFKKIYLETLRFLLVHKRGEKIKGGNDGVASGTKVKYHTKWEYLPGKCFQCCTPGYASFLCYLALSIKKAPAPCAGAN